MFIKLSDDQNAPVALTITIDGISHWNYTYNGDNRIDNSEKINKPKKHDLGQVSSLKLDNNYWKIELWNILDTDIEVTVKMEWTGGVLDTTTWISGNEIIKVPANSRKKLTGAAKFI